MAARKQTLDKTAGILEERGATHGDFTENARVSQEIMDVLQTAPSWDELSYVQREALHMFAHKMARIVGGNPNVQDHWDDIGGYARLASERITSS